MGIFDGCLLACDIDGTLMINGYINPKNVEKIEYFMSEGGKFSISTGRSVCAIGDVLRQVKRISPSIVANGCMITVKIRFYMKMFCQKLIAIL